MIAVLPLLLYPLLGMSMFQVAQFVREQPTHVLVVGMTQPADLAAAVRRGPAFAEDCFPIPTSRACCELHFAADRAGGRRRHSTCAMPTSSGVERGNYEAVLVLSAGLCPAAGRFRGTCGCHGAQIRTASERRADDCKVARRPARKSFTTRPTTSRSWPSSA